MCVSAAHAVIDGIDGAKRVRAAAYILIIRCGVNIIVTLLHPSNKNTEQRCTRHTVIERTRRCTHDTRSLCMCNMSSLHYNSIFKVFNIFNILKTFNIFLYIFKYK